MATKQKRIYKCVLKYPFCCICSLLHPEIFLLFLLFLFLHTVASTTFLMQHYITQYNSASAFPDPIVLLQSWIWKHFNTKLLVLEVCQWTMELWFIWLVDIEFLPANVLWSKIQLYQSNSNWRNKVRVCHFLQTCFCVSEPKSICVFCSSASCHWKLAGLAANWAALSMPALAPCCLCRELAAKPGGDGANPGSPLGVCPTTSTHNSCISLEQSWEEL